MATQTELDQLSALCLRSKAYWGYDEVFLDACRKELTVTPDDLSDLMAVTRASGNFTGVVQISLGKSDSDGNRFGEIEKLFIAPDAMGQGLGQLLFGWSIEQARRAGTTQLHIDADPGALGFYERMGAVQVGTTPSGSIPGRELPHLRLDI
ncbi:MAG: GNAT family N-acetyltransferase [Paracoccaceae bacterium]